MWKHLVFIESMLFSHRYTICATSSQTTIKHDAFCVLSWSRRGQLVYINDSLCLTWIAWYLFIKSNLRVHCDSDNDLIWHYQVRIPRFCHHVRYDLIDKRTQTPHKRQAYDNVIVHRQCSCLPWLVYNFLAC